MTTGSIRMLRQTKADSERSVSRRRTAIGQKIDRKAAGMIGSGYTNKPGTRRQLATFKVNMARLLADSGFSGKHIIEFTNRWAKRLRKRKSPTFK